MAASLNAAVRLETVLFQGGGSQQQQQRTLPVSWAAAGASGGSLYNFTLQSVGGVLFLNDCVPGAHLERGIHWQIENSATGALHLTEFTVHGGAVGPRTTVEVPLQLFPALAATGTSDGRLLLAALLSNRYLLHFELSVSSSNSEAILAGLSAASLRPLDLSHPLAQLGTPMSLAATAEAILIGGSNGSTLCVPLASLVDSNHARCFELRDSSWALTKLIPGMLYRPRQPAALACMPVTVSGKHILLVSYDDCMLRAFSVSRRCQLATLELETPGAGHATVGGGARHMVPTYITADTTPPAAGANGTAAAADSDTITLIAQFEAADTLRRHTYMYAVSATHGGSRLAVAQVSELAMEAGAVVSEARVARDTVWLLVRVQGRAKVVGYDRSSGALVSSAVLVEAAGEPVGVAAAAAANGAEVDQELWEWLLAAFPGELTAEGQVCQQVLVPGQLCRPSLRDALSYHGAQLSSTEVDAASHGVLRGWMQAAVLAIQRRAPSASPAECWQSLLATYRASWARRHPPLALVLHRASPDWLGLARGGSVLCVLRRGTGVEALHGADAVAPLELPPHLDAVHRCAAEAGSLLGPLAQEACLALMAAGVDPLERLVPKLCELWIGGPAAAATAGQSASASSGGAGGGSSRAAALTDAAREAQLRWRQRRQQQIIAMGQRLGGLSNPANAIQSYLGLLRLLNSAVSAELNAAASAGSAAQTHGSVAAPSRAAAAFLVATCRQVSRAAAAAARDAALLLGLVQQLCALGTVPLERGALGRLQGALLPEACGLLRRAALGMWLTGTSAATQGDLPDMEPALSAFRHLRLGGSGSPPAKRNHGEGPGAPATDGHSAAPAAGDTSLAARLLPSFLAAYGGVGAARKLDLLTGAESAGLLYTLYLQYGEQPSCSVAARVLQLGCRLFQVGEYGSLAELSCLAGATGSTEAGPQFLRGLGITCALALERQQQQAAQQQQQQAPHAQRRRGDRPAAVAAPAAAMAPRSGASRADLIAEAAGCFFRAAASLTSEAGETLRSILQDLRTELAGDGAEAGGAAAAGSKPAAVAGGASGAPVAAQRREVALLQLRFCEAVMQLFEREGAPEGAVVFASAALEHLRTAYGPADAAPSALLPGEERVVQAAAAERAVREGRLWSNIYSYSVEMRQYDRAYAALLANPLPAARLQSLRHLVHAMTQDGQLQMLCTLPYAGVAVVPASDAPSASHPAPGAPTRTVSLLGEALQVLHRRAHNCDLLAEQPQPYQVLYDFLVCRGDFRGAARAMAAYAWRLRAEAPASSAEAVAEALRAYDLAVHCLSLLNPEDAWLDLTDPWLAKHAPQHLTRHLRRGGGAAHGSSTALALQQGGAAGGGRADEAAAGAAAASALAAAPVETIRSLQRERTMLYYCSQVAARVAGLEPMRQWDNEEAILRQLLIMGRYGGALALVADCYPAVGQQQHGPGGGGTGGAGGAGGGDGAVRALESIVAALATHCARLQLQDGGISTGGPTLPPTDLFVDDPDGCGTGAAPSGLGAGAAAVAGTLGGRAGPLWSKLRQLLAGVAAQDAVAEGGAAGGGGRRVGWLLRDAAAEAVLRTDPRIDLPQWLLDMFLQPAPGASEAPCGMGSHAGGPASLLALYLRHDRLAAAVEVVAGAVAEWGRADVRQRRRLCAAWMPYPQLELLRTKLNIAVELGDGGGAGGLASSAQAASLLRALDAAVSSHLELVATDAERLAEQQQHGSSSMALDAPSGAASMDMGGMSGGFGFGAGLGGAPPLLMLGAAATPMTPAGQVLFGGAGGVGGGATGGVRLFG